MALTKMKNAVFFFAILFLCSAAVAQTCDLDGTAGTEDLCCDPDGGGFFDGFLPCGTSGEGTYDGSDNLNSDFNCGPVTADCTTIPLDGGLSLLALAGGGLATAAMRRRREEEALQADES